MLRKINNVSENFCEFESEYNNSYTGEYQDLCGVVVFNDRFMTDMLGDWNKMLKLYRNNAIDNDILKLWEEKTINKYNFPIGYIDEPITDDDLPL